jgi:hypothetical protein
MSQQKIEVSIDIYNRIHDWGRSISNVQFSIKLIDYFQNELFSKKEGEKCVFYETVFHGHLISFDIPPIYYMRIFGGGYGIEGKMSCNNTEIIKSIRQDMINHVCSKLNWSNDHWDQFHSSIQDLRNKIIAHFDATKLIFDDDSKGYGYMNLLMNPKSREELNIVVGFMKEYLSRFKVSD